MKTSFLVENLVGIAAIALIVAGCFAVLRPFLTPILWAAIICYTTWPLYVRLRTALHGRRSLAATLMILLFALVLVTPFALVAANIAGSVADGVRWLHALAAEPLRPPPEWLANLPLVGTAAAEKWVELSGNMKATLSLARNFLAENGGWFLRRGIGLTSGVFQLCISLLIAFFFFRGGDVIGAKISAAFGRIAGDHTQRYLQVIGGTVKGTVYGVLGTALAQGIVAFVGFLIAGIPSPLLLGLLTFFLAIVPVGPPLVWGPAAIWLFSTGRIGMGVFMTVYGFVAISGIDNVVKPYLMSKGTNLPFVLVLLGVFGGVLAFGFLGVFLGPTLLAVGYCLAREWTDSRTPPATSSEPIP